MKINAVNTNIKRNNAPAFKARVLIDLTHFPETRNCIKLSKIAKNGLLSIVKKLKEQYKDNDDLIIRLGVMDNNSDPFTFKFRNFVQYLQGFCEMPTGAFYCDFPHIRVDKLIRPRVQNKVIKEIDDTVSLIQKNK